MKRLHYVLLFAFTSMAHLSWGAGEPATYFNIFVPPNATTQNRDVCLVVTAFYDSTTFEIVDDGMDGDTDDSKIGMLMAGQSYVLYIRDNGINDDAPHSGESTTKWDGDYFIIKSNNLVYASQSTNSDWQHDWVPAVNKSSLGQKFIIYAPQVSSSNRDINVFAYTDSTIVTIRKISTVKKTTTGFTTVNYGAKTIIGQQLLKRGEDLIYKYSLGRDVMQSGETYVIEATNPVTCQYGALYGNERDGGGYVPSNNGSSSGSLFYFAVPYQAAGEQEIRFVSWNPQNQVTLSRYSNGSWISMKSWTLDSLKAGDWVGKNNSNASYSTVFKVECTAGKKISIFEGNWLETGSIGTSDMATMLSSSNGTTSGNRFLSYMCPPGEESNVKNPFTGQKFSQASHAYIFASFDTVHVTVKDAYTVGQKINRTYTIAPQRYVDCFLTTNEWKSIYNGTGTIAGGPERPYLLISSDKPVSVMNTNFNDNWMMYFGTSARQNISQTSTSSKNSAIPGDTVTIKSTINFLYPVNMANTDIEVIVADGLLPIKSIFTDVTSGRSINGNMGTGTSGTVITFANEPTLISTHQYEVTTQVVVQVNYTNGAPMTTNIVTGAETVISGTVNGIREQSLSSESFQDQATNTSRMRFTRMATVGIATDVTNSWTGAWIDYNNDGWEDLFVTEYDRGKANLLYKNNGNKTFTKVTAGDLGGYKQGAVTSTWADVDNDGDLDMVMTNNYGYQNSLYINSNGSFTRNTTSAALLNEKGYFHGASFADYDRDGKLDLFLCNYMPTKYHVLFKGNGDGTFAKISKGEIASEAHFSIGATWADYDNDGWPDLFIPNGRGDKNSLFHNNGDGTFEKIVSGSIVNEVGNSVGSAWGDYDNDGDLDLFVINASRLGNWLYRNDGAGQFTKMSMSGVTTDKGDSHGCAWMDIDNDGDLDLYVTNDKAEIKFMYLNNGVGGFSKLSNDPVIAAVGNSFGNSWADYDRDGDLDVFLATHSGEINFLYDNNGNANKWTSIRLVGTVSNKTAVGARIRVKANGRWQIREVTSQSGMGGQSSLRAHVGLGLATLIDSIEVRWPSGYVQVLTNQPANQYLTITEESTVRMSGVAFYDKNGNCKQDVDEATISGLQVEMVESGQKSYSNQQGVFAFQVGTGSYHLKVNSDKWSYVCPTPLQAQVNSLNSTVAASPLPVVASSDFMDTKTEIATTALRKGFRGQITLHVQNRGTQSSTNDTLSLHLDNSIVVLSASVPWNSKNGNTYYWYLPSTPIGTDESILLIDSVSRQTTVGNTLSLSARMSNKPTDNNLSNNLFGLTEKIVGAIDPNYLTVSPEGEGTGGYISRDQLLHYTVHFENMGNYAATNVLVENELPEGLDVSQLEVEMSSHQYEMEVVNNRFLRIHFRNIELADSSRQEENKGFIRYSVPASKQIAAGELIQNQANITFDYEDPILTNITLNTVKETSIASQLVIAPNPCQTEAIVRVNYFDPAFYDHAISSYSIENLEGKEVKSERGINRLEIAVGCETIKTGIYILHVTDQDGKKLKGRFIRR